MMDDKNLRICLIKVSQEISYYGLAITELTHQSMIKNTQYSV